MPYSKTSFLLGKAEFTSTVHAQTQVEVSYLSILRRVLPSKIRATTWNYRPSAVQISASCALCTLLQLHRNSTVSLRCPMSKIGVVLLLNQTHFASPILTIVTRNWALDATLLMEKLDALPREQIVR